MATLTFLGAAGTVTGSKYLVEESGRRILVDCGLFQGLKHLRERNWQPLPVPAKSIEAVVLTHAHLDHSGYLPRLVSEGFRGRIFCTPGTADLCRILLPDAGRLQEEDARYANRKGFSKHTPALPLFAESDALRTLTQLQPLGFERTVTVAPGFELTYTHTGHLLGAAAAHLRIGGRKTVVFGGDLGRYNRPVLRDPDPVKRADVLLIESTYGDRRHVPDDEGAQLGQIVRETIGQGGKVIIPSFAIGRVEEVLYRLRQLEADKAIPRVPVFLDSPMAIEALHHYVSRSNELDDELHGAGRTPANFVTEHFQVIETARRSAELTASSVPAVVISSSGMATGGRVLHHLRRALPDPRCAVVFVGYQAQGTRGQLLVDGASEVKIHGRMVPVAARVVKLDSMSAHADASEILSWLGHFESPPEMTCVVHGEPPAAAALRDAIESEMGWRAQVASYLGQLEL
ncbi:MAG TPA: MBL fold metallo-hydrolase [Vicinamibacterales bacterium]|nr:MBL fold metallo-hydrolase [Vicinamibacterales bacterium]